MDLAQIFRGELIGGRIANFPYGEKKCRYCNKNCELIDVVHIYDRPEHYKALYICQNRSCACYDEEARKAYAKVYYSSDEAYQKLELKRIWYNTNKLDKK